MNSDELIGFRLKYASWRNRSLGCWAIHPAANLPFHTGYLTCSTQRQHLFTCASIAYFPLLSALAPTVYHHRNVPVTLIAGTSYNSVYGAQATHPNPLRTWGWELAQVWDWTRAAAEPAAVHRVALQEWQSARRTTVSNGSVNVARQNASYHCQRGKKLADEKRSGGQDENATSFRATCIAGYELTGFVWNRQS